MKYKKFVAVLFIGIFLLSILPQTAAAPDEREGPLYKLFTRFWNWAHDSFLGPLIFQAGMVGWKPFRFTEPPFFTANPSSVDIKYLNNTEIIISSIDYQKQLVTQKEYITFDLEFPENISENTWFFTFDPPVLYPGEGKTNISTKLVISTRIPEDQEMIPKDLLFKINITRHATFGNIWIIPPEVRLIKGGQFIGPFWTLSAILAGYGTLSGKTTEDTITLDILVKESRYHLAEIVPPEKVEIGPNKLISIPLEVINLGSHVDVFNFRASTDSKLLVSPPPAITLQPNEVGHTSIGVASLRLFNDPGSARSINIEAYSIYEPETIFNNTATVITRGVYVSEVIGYYFTMFMGVVVLFVAFIFYRRRRFLAKMCKKPEKPWTIPEEKKHLKELKKKDKNKFEKVRLMMEDEYKSAMLWYNDYCYYAIKQKGSIGNMLTSFFKKLVKKKPKQPKKEKKPVKKEIKIEDDQRIKEKVLLKILREQEKQKRKLKI